MLQFPAWKKILIALVSLLGVLYALPNVTGSFQPWSGYPTWAPGKPMSLGLDLRGGAHLLVQVRIEDVVAERLESGADGIRFELRDQRVRASGFDVDPERRAITFAIRNSEDAEAARAAIQEAAPEYEVESPSDTRFRLTMT